MDFLGKTILVTGGAGFIGSHLVDALIGEGARVRVIDNLANGKLENFQDHRLSDRFKFIEGDINDEAAIDEAMKDVDVVFHLACLGVRHSIKFPFQNHRVNAEGTLSVLRSALKNGVRRLVYCSSSEVYGTALSVPMKETHTTYPCTIYGASKLAGESYVRAYNTTYGLETMIIRPFNTYGERSHHEGDAGEMIPKSIVRALNAEPIFIFGDGLQTRDFTYVKDTARGILTLAQCDDAVGMTLNVGSDFEIPIKKVAGMIRDMAGGRSNIEHLNGRPGDVLRLFADSSLFRKLTGWKPDVSFESGLLKTVEWFKSRPIGLEALLAEEKGINWK